MTKYVVNSGGLRNMPELKKKFHQELVKDLGASPKILQCLFAQGREYWESKLQTYCESFSEDMPNGVAPSFELALPADFERQCAGADIIYIYGGDDHLLQYWMKQFDLKKLFANKVVGTSSAGSDMLAAHYWTCDWRQCADGLGLLLIKFIPHYQFDIYASADPRGPIEWQKAYDELLAYGDTTLPVYALKEGEFVVLT